MVETAAAEEAPVAEQQPAAAEAVAEEEAPTAEQTSGAFCFPLSPTVEPRVIPPGVRPVALKAVLERERMRAPPHRCQSAVNFRRAQRIAGGAKA